MLPTPARGTLARLVAAVLALSALLTLAACGDDDADSATAGTTAETTASSPALPQRTDATLVLDFLPGGVHAGIFLALEKGYYEQNNIDLRVIQPTSTADTLKLIDAGRADFGIADGIDVANQIAEGRDAKAIGALAQKPLGGLITLRSSSINDPKQLEGRTVGVTGVPSDEVILNTIVQSAGGDVARVKKVTIGFNGVQNLTTGKVDAFTGFWPADGVQIEVGGDPINVFKLDENGGPAYPGLVFFSTQDRIAADGPLMAAFMDATARGYADAIADPAAALDALIARNPALKRDVEQRVLETYIPLFTADAPAFGVMSAQALEELSDFLVENGLIDEPITPDRYGTNEFVPRG